MRELTFLERIRARQRLQQIYDVILRYGYDGVFGRGALGAFRRRMQQLLHRPPHRVVPLSGAVKARLMLQELGPTYVKMGQLVSSQSTALPSAWQIELAKLQSDVKPFPIDEVRMMLADELGGTPEELFETFDPKPLGSASTAQVHRATLADGRDIVVKIQRPNIVNQLKADVTVLSRVAQLMERRTVWAREVGMVGVINEFGSNLIDELDYTGEAFNARRIARNLESIEGVAVPGIVRGLSTKRILTMDFAPGVKVSDVDEIIRAGLDPNVVADRALRAAIKMLLIDGFFHADPHPGNVLVDLEDGTVTFIDLGMVGELSLRQRAYFINLLLVAQQSDALGLAQTLRSLSEPFRQVADDSFYHDFERRVGRFMEPGEKVGFAKIMSAALDVLRDNGLRLDPQLTLALKALTQAEGFTRALYARGGRGDFVDEGLSIVTELVADNVTPELITDSVKKQLVFVGREVAGRIPSLQEATGKWLDQYLKGQLSVKVDTSDLDPQIRSLGRLARALTAGFLLAGVVIGSAIASRVTDDSSVSFLTEIAQVFFVGGASFAVIVVAVLAWRLIREQSTDRP